MKIQAYKADIEIIDQSELKEGFRTGLVCARYYDPSIMEIEGELIDIKLVCDSLDYSAGETKANSVMVIEQAKVTIHHQKDTP